MIRIRSLALGTFLALAALTATLPLASVAANGVRSGAAWPRDPAIVVRDVLAQPAYRTAPVTSAEKPKPSLWQEVWDWIRARFKEFFGPVARAVAGASRVGAWLGIALMIAAFLGLAFVLVRLALAFAAPEARAQRNFAGRALVQRRSSAEWREAASALAARGEYARAIAALFGAALAELDERALVPFDASRTPGEYRRLVRRVRAEAAPPFDELSAGFVRAAFSGVPAGPADFASAERAFAGFEPNVALP